MTRRALIATLWCYAVVASVAVVVLAAATPVPSSRGTSDVDLLSALVAVLFLSAVTATAMLCSLAAIIGLASRYRRARGVRRLQLRWLVTALVALAVSVPPAAIFEQTAVGSIIFEVFWALPPIAIGVAILRYRLYELDRLVSRTLVYAVVTAVLFGVYTVIVTLPSVLLDVESDLRVAAATLAAAGAFVPLRRRVQDLVDRRFNRSRYDAQRVVERFGSWLRDDLDLDSLTGDVHAVVTSTVQPVHLSLWLREGR